MQEAQSCAEALTAYVASAAAALPTSECEVLYGRAGMRAYPDFAVPLQAVLTWC